MASSSDGVVIGDRLVEVENRSETGVDTVERGDPVVARPAGEPRRERLADDRPVRSIPAVGQVGEAQHPDQVAPERLLERPDGDEPTIRTAIGAVEGRRAVEQVASLARHPAPGGLPRPLQLREQTHPVDHGRVDDLTSPGALSVV